MEHLFLEELSLEGKLAKLVDGSDWKLEDRISQHFYPPKSELYGVRQVDSCVRVEPAPRLEAIVKIHAQSRPQIRSGEATTKLPFPTIMECEALELLTKKGCSCTPKVLHLASDIQDEDTWVPGGYIVYIFMEKLPGTSLRNFFERFDRTQRDKVRAAFRAAFM
ncbi:hypothetical protein AJ80_08446 [Polytolypa hystricis UAMH7299]|uniref:Protein kinase domain-containing protein n=1 Tax=Polytolypa hystricis (strain UAMH7299) TaxID=1447883 RepID=A0A2B7X855_POLH7|nr:hypothetical protein AJ80_08446 [Polytolypa hystricis UAMH7299]